MTETLPALPAGNHSSPNRPAPAPVDTPPPPVFGWPTAVVLLGLAAMSFAFAYLLIRTGYDDRSAVVTTLTLLSGSAVVVLPATNRALIRRVGAAASGAVRGWRR